MDIMFLYIRFPLWEKSDPFPKTKVTIWAFHEYVFCILSEMHPYSSLSYMSYFYCRFYYLERLNAIKFLLELHEHTWNSSVSCAIKNKFFQNNLKETWNNF